MGDYSRRNFLKTGLVAGALAGTGTLALADRKTATDWVTLGRSNVKVTRLAFGTGSMSGQVQASLGQDKFTSLVRYAYDRGIRFFETSESYGDPSVHPQVETYWGNVNPVGPRSCYDESKRFAEALTMAYHRARGARTSIARIFNTFGPRMKLNDGRVVPAFLDQSLRGQPITIFGDGSQTRSFCYVSDLVDGLYRLMLSNETMPVNVGNPREMTIRQFAEVIALMTGSTAGIEYHPLPEDDPKQRRPDISKATRLLGWTPKVTLEEGLKHTVEYFQHLSELATV